MTKKEKVLRTALQLVAAGGFQGAPIAELAAKSKVAVGTIYHHFAGKDEMVVAMYRLCKESLSLSLEPALSEKANAAKKFDKVWNALMDFAVKNAVEFSFLDQYKSSPLITVAATKSAEKFDASLVKFFNDGVKSKDFRKADGAQLMEFFYSNAFHAARVIGKKKKGSAKDIEPYRDMTWAGVKR